MEPSLLSLLVAAAVAYTIATIYVCAGCHHESIVGRWLSLLDVPQEWVANYCPPILWPLTWPFFMVAYALAVPLALLSSRLFVPQKFRR